MLPDDETRRWLFDVWAWLLSGLGGFDRFVSGRRLVLPTHDDFPVEDLAGYELAEDYLGFVREHARIPDGWQLVLVSVGDGTEEEPAEGVMPVAFRPGTVDRPELLVAQLATGIAEHLVRSIGEGAPGDERADYAVDVCAVFLGFGTFLANSASSLEGWALPEREVSYALAIFAWLLQIRDGLVLSHLDDNPSAFYSAAVRDLRHQGTALTRLRETKALHEGPYR